VNKLQKITKEGFIEDHKFFQKRKKNVKIIKKKYWLLPQKEFTKKKQIQNLIG
jgi:hypothetical protein